MSIFSQRELYVVYKEVFKNFGSLGNFSIFYFFITLILTNVMHSVCKLAAHLHFWNIIFLKLDNNVLL